MNDSSSLPIFKTRKFWIFTIALNLVAGSVIYTSLLSQGVREGYWMFFDFVFSYGGALFLLVAPTTNVGYISGIGYVVLMFYLLITAFKETRVNVLKMIIFNTLFLTGIISALLFW